MKKAVSIFLAFLISLSAIGVQVTLHHCKGETSYIIFGIDFNKQCKCKHETKNNRKCCDKKSFVVKTVGDSFANVVKTVSFNKVCLNKFLISNCTVSISSVYKSNVCLNISIAPPVRGVPINTLNCVFRI